MTHQHIYNDAKEKIEKILEELKIEHYLTPPETNYKVLRVEDELVVFEIHKTLKELIQKQYNLKKPSRNKIKFKEKTSDTWELIFECDGVESHFFARILEVVLEKLNKEKHDRINSGKQIIKESLEEVIKGFDGKNTYPNRIWYKKGVYYMLVHANGAKIVFQNQCPHYLKNEINEKLLELLEVITKNKRIKK